MSIKLSQTYLAIALALGCTSSALASNYFIHADTQFTSEADIKGTNGNVQNSVYGISAGYMEKNEIFSVEYKRSEYDFSFNNAPFDGLNKLAFDYSKDVTFASNLHLYFGVNLATLFESSISLSDSYSISPRAAFGWNFYDNITGYLGAYANFNAADNVFLPIIGLRIGNDSDIGWTGSIAYPKTKLQYRFNKSLAADLTYIDLRDTYYIENDNRDEYFREEAKGLSLGVSYSFNKSIQASTGVFCYYDREFKFYNDAGNVIDSYEIDNNVGAYARLNYSF